MSYCRWSSDSFRCDVYAYESVYGGFELHLASNRIPDDAPRVDDKLLYSDISKWCKQYNKLSKYMETCKHTKIDHEFSGASFTYDTLEELRDGFIKLREQGFNYPDYVLEDINEEINNQ
jgi:hypothetical protein